LRRGVHSARFFFKLVRMWIKVNAALVLVCAVALAAGAPVGTALGAVVIAWMLASYGFWRVWRRGI
jgi:hypothetical protein